MVINRKLWALVEPGQQYMPKMFRTRALAVKRKKLMCRKYKNHVVKHIWFSLSDNSPRA